VLERLPTALITNPGMEGWRPDARPLTSWSCRALELAAAALGDGDEPIVHSPRGSRDPESATLAAVAVLGEREAQLSAVQRLALVDAAAW
jgi:hypothetical protein